MTMACESSARRLRRFAASCVIFVLAGASSAWPQDVAVLDFPADRPLAELPVGLSDYPRETSEGLAAIEIPLLAVNDEGCLLVTAMFEDAEDRVILAKWLGPDGTAEVVSANLCDGLRGWNQKTFQVPGRMLEEDGVLVLETDAESQPVRRITLAWAWPAGVYMGTAAQTVRCIPDASRVLTERDLAPAKAGPLPDAWSAGIWKAYLQEQVESLEDPVAFAVPIDALPRAVVFRARVLGFPMDTAPAVWVNGKKLPLVSVEVPALSRPGYFRNDDGGLRFAGWRDAQVVVPPEYLAVGENTIVLAAQSGGYINDALLELSFEDEGAPLIVGRAAEYALSPQPSEAAFRAGTAANRSLAEAPFPPEPTVIVTPPSL